MKTLISATLSIAILLASCWVAFARDCYVSTSGHDTNNNGLSSGSPYLTLSKILSSCSTSGDQVYLNRGDDWNEKLYTKTGVDYQAYGTGANPIVNQICNFSSACNNQTDFTISDIDVSLHAAGSYPLTLRGVSRVVLKNVTVKSNTYDTGSTGVLVDDGASHDQNWPEDIVMIDVSVYGFTRGIGGAASDVVLINPRVYNPGIGSAGIEPTGAESYATAAKFPDNWYIYNAYVECNNAAYENNGDGERGINIGWLSGNVTVDRAYVKGCGYLNTGFDYSIDYNTGYNGPNVIKNSISDGAGWNAFFAQTAATATNALVEGKILNAYVYNNTFRPSASADQYARTVRFVENAANATPFELYFYNNIVESKASNTDVVKATYTNGTLELNNNLYYNTAAGDIQWAWNASTLTTLANWKSTSSQDSNALAVDPKLNANETLQSDSPAIGAGLWTSFVYTDYSGKARDVFNQSNDIGAYQYATTTGKKLGTVTLKSGTF
jgi:hypothetical protein